uniref:succinate dehydrogenase cytochrome B560 subunit n=1 Tax=Mimica arnoldii TaxID=88407 RepID=UPI0027A56824|nr:succinate dehydrogenase cytochrome B560 subunit [Mimica arnoldii]WGO62532.1 succinate dehydrogenase cytochrome B560 subunit [Mimica arnoldii]
MKVYTSNRPISPHLSIHRPQNSSLSSIWHRITGVFLLIILSSSIINLKLVLNFNFFIQMVYNSYHYFFTFSYLLLVLFFSYHALNGLRHILWDFGFLFRTQNLSYSFSVIVLFSFMISMLNLGILCECF